MKYKYISNTCTKKVIVLGVSKFYIPTNKQVKIEQAVVNTVPLFFSFYMVLFGNLIHYLIIFR